MASVHLLTSSKNFINFWINLPYIGLNASPKNHVEDVVLVYSWNESCDFVKAGHNEPVPPGAPTKSRQRKSIVSCIFTERPQNPLNASPVQYLLLHSRLKSLCSAFGSVLAVLLWIICFIKVISCYTNKVLVGWVSMRRFIDLYIWSWFTEQDNGRPLCCSLYHLSPQGVLFIAN